MTSKPPKPALMGLSKPSTLEAPTILVLSTIDI